MNSRINISRVANHGCILLIFAIIVLSTLYLFLDKYLLGTGIKTHIETYVVAIINLVALITAYFAVIYTRQVNETLQISDFNRRYSSDEILCALRQLRKVADDWENDKSGAPTFQKRTLHCTKTSHPLICRYCHRHFGNNPKEPVSIKNYQLFVTEDTRNLPWTINQDTARRKVKGFYISALKLYSSRSISKNAFLEIIDTDGITLLFDVVEPMEALLNEHYNWEPFHDIMNITDVKFWEKKTEQTKAHVKKNIFKA